MALLLRVEDVNIEGSTIAKMLVQDPTLTLAVPSSSVDGSSPCLVNQQFCVGEVSLEPSSCACVA